jgi:uncharacterized protein YkwD
MIFSRSLKTVISTTSLLALASLTWGCDSPSDAIATIPGSTGGSPVSNTVQLDVEESAFVTLINKYRAQNGAPALQVSLALTHSSQWMSQDMAANNYLDHTDSLGRDPFTRMAAFGYSATYMGENIAAGYDDAQDTFNQWTSDAAHNANMLDASYLVIGVARANNPSSTYGWYWTTDFGSTVDQTLTVPLALPETK